MYTGGEYVMFRRRARVVISNRTAHVYKTYGYGTVFIFITNSRSKTNPGYDPRSFRWCIPVVRVPTGTVLFVTRLFRRLDFNSIQTKLSSKLCRVVFRFCRSHHTPGPQVHGSKRDQRKTTRYILKMHIVD